MFKAISESIQLSEKRGFILSGKDNSANQADTHLFLL